MFHHTNCHYSEAVSGFKQKYEDVIRSTNKKNVKFFSSLVYFSSLVATITQLCFYKLNFTKWRSKRNKVTWTNVITQFVKKNIKRNAVKRLCQVQKGRITCDILGQRIYRQSCWLVIPKTKLALSENIVAFTVITDWIFHQWFEYFFRDYSQKWSRTQKSSRTLVIIGRNNSSNYQGFRIVPNYCGCTGLNKSVSSSVKTSRRYLTILRDLFSLNILCRIYKCLANLLCLPRHRW